MTDITGKQWFSQRLDPTMNRFWFEMLVSRRKQKTMQRIAREDKTRCRKTREIRQAARPTAPSFEREGSATTGVAGHHPVQNSVRYQTFPPLRSAVDRLSRKAERAMRSADRKRRVNMIAYLRAAFRAESADKKAGLGFFVPTQFKRACKEDLRNFVGPAVHRN